MDLDIIVYGDITLRQCLYWLAVVVAGYVILKVVKRLFFTRAAPMQHSVTFVCNACGWQGRIGQYAARCPKCGQSVK